MKTYTCKSWREGQHERHRLGELLVSEEDLDIYLAKRPKQKWSARQTRTRNTATLICFGKFNPQEEGLLIDDTLLGKLPPPQPWPFLKLSIASSARRYKVCQALLPRQTFPPAMLLSSVRIPYERQSTLIASLPCEIVGAKSRRKLRVHDEDMCFHYENEGILIALFYVVWSVYLLPPILARPGNFLPKVRQALLETADYKCQRCGSSERLEVDHMEPLWKGGEPTFENGQVLCRDCHLRKSRKEGSFGANNWTAGV